MLQTGGPAEPDDVNPKGWNDGLGYCGQAASPLPTSYGTWGCAISSPSVPIKHSAAK